MQPTCWTPLVYKSNLSQALATFINNNMRQLVPHITERAGSQVLVLIGNRLGSFTRGQLGLPVVALLQAFENHVLSPPSLLAKLKGYFRRNALDSVMCFESEKKSFLLPLETQ
ncbi:hypothetical protein TNCV_2214311 [Trichonephila clavipes]|nr:hypothetical protein TNCV_2214311 [Trichonephila clavipes]